MSVTRYRRLVRLNNYLCGFLTVMPVLLLTVSYFTDMEMAWTLLPAAAVILLSFLLQEYCRNFLLFTLGSLLCLAPVLPAALRAGLPGQLIADIPHVAPLLIYLTFSILLVILNFVRKLRRSEDFFGENFPLAGLISPAAVQILASALKQDAILPWILAGGVCLILFRYFNEYLLGYTAFLEEMKTSAEVPFGQIASSGGWMLSLFFSLTALAMTFCCFLPLGRLLPAIGNGLLYGIRLLVRLLGRLFADGQNGTADVSGEVPPPPPPEPPLPTNSETSPFWMFLQKLLDYILPGVIIMSVIALLLYGIFRLVRAFYSRQTLTNDRVEFLDPFERKERLAHPAAREIGAFRRIFGSSPEQRIRKLWYRTIRSRLTGVSAGMTPRELAGKLAEHPAGSTVSHLTGKPVSGSEQREGFAGAISELTDIYEKARYSRHSCTKEDAALSKAADRKIKIKSARKAARKRGIL